jgi:hypothetical protein
MTDAGFLYVLIAGTALLIFAIVSAISYYKRPEPVKAPDPIIGYITEVRQDENGIFINGQLNDRGTALFPGDTISWQSLSVGVTPDGLIETVAVVPKPCKGKNGNVCVAEGCYGEACVHNDK